MLYQLEILWCTIPDQANSEWIAWSGIDIIIDWL